MERPEAEPVDEGLEVVDERAPRLDRNVESPVWSADGKGLYVTACDVVYRIRMKVAGMMPGPKL